MRVSPQQDGSLQIEEPAKTAGYDLGNRSLFVKTNGRGDLNQIYFAHGGHAGAWHLGVNVNGKPVEFSNARAIGRLWQLSADVDAARMDVSVFLDEKSPATFERIEVNAGDRGIAADISLEFDITPPPAPKGWLKHLVAVYIPRIPAFSWYWGWGLGRWLQTPAPQSMDVADRSTLNARGKVAWQFGADQSMESCSILGKKAEIHYSLKVPAHQSACLNMALAESSGLTAQQALTALPQALADAKDYAQWLNRQVDVADPILRSLYVSGLNASKAMYKEFPGGFRGLVAGPDYAYPPRIYYRDSYWTAQALIDTAPDLVREHLINLAAGVHPNGSCPSGVFAAHLLKIWKAPANCDADWLADHFDSPSFFILLLNDYLQKTGDWDLLKVVPAQINPRLNWPARTIAEKAHAVIEYLISRDADGDGLIEKPYKANDWADNIRRSIWVSYDQGLYIAALRAYIGLCPHLNAQDDPQHYSALADKALDGMYRELWDDRLGYFVNYRRPDFTETNLSVDTFVVLYFNLLDEAHTSRMLDAAKRMLRARNNQEQPYGDYGLLCTYPPYAKAEDLFDKSASPYCYHNCADWPYWDGMLSDVLLRRRDPLGMEVLTRWWEYGLEQGWLTPVEYYSPAFPVGGMLQGWSSMAAASLLRNISVVKELKNEAAIDTPKQG
jgi:hypothetical protein